MVRSNELAPHVHDWWSHFLNPVRHFGESVAQFLSPTADAAATGEAYEIAVELPGNPEDGIQPEIQGDRPVVSGENCRARGKRPQL